MVHYFARFVPNFRYCCCLAFPPLYWREVWVSKAMRCELILYMSPVINSANILVSFGECFSGPSSPWWILYSREPRIHHWIQLVLFLIHKKRRFFSDCQTAISSKKLYFLNPYVFFLSVFSLVQKGVLPPVCGQDSCLSPDDDTGTRRTGIMWCADIERWVENGSFGQLFCFIFFLFLW